MLLKSCTGHTASPRCDEPNAVVIAANMPTPANLDCEPADRAPADIVINGSEDSINPYDGVEAALFRGFEIRGEIRSARHLGRTNRDFAAAGEIWRFF
jgi:hypothetical protein